MAPDTEPGLVVAAEQEGGGGLKVGVAPSGAAQAVDVRGNLAPTYAVQGSELLLWAAVLP